jgi:hypothetical protein
LTGGYFREDWTHEAHFAVLIYLLRCRPEIDLNVSIAGLWRASNEAQGIENTDTGGYHETMTRVYLNAVRDFLREVAGQSLVEICNAVLQSPVSDRNYPEIYYSQEKLYSVAARRYWIDADMTKLPAHWKKKC